MLVLTFGFGGCTGWSVDPVVFLLNAVLRQNNRVGE